MIFDFDTTFIKNQKSLLNYTIFILQKRIKIILQKRIKIFLIFFRKLHFIYFQETQNNYIKLPFFFVFLLIYLHIFLCAQFFHVNPLIVHLKYE